MIHNVFYPCLLALLLCSFQSIAADDIYLFRHAEKQADGSKDPGLTQVGRQRAQWLANWLKSKNIGHIYTTDYRRTRQTIAPLASQSGLTAISYDPRKLAQLAKTLRQQPGTVVVVGHSNTTPELVQLLGGEPGDKITESEYDRIYRLHINGKQTQTRRYHSTASK